MRERERERDRDRDRDRERARLAQPARQTHTSQALLGDAELTYTYDGTLEGFFTAVFAAYERREDPQHIMVEAGLQESLLGSTVGISTDLGKARRVCDGISEKLGERGYKDVKCAFLSDDPDKGGIILRFLRYALGLGNRAGFAGSHLAHPSVSPFSELVRIVDKEAHAMLQFVRFAELEGGLYFSRIDPKASIVPLIMDHFAERLNVQPFMILDTKHKIAGVFDTERWWLADASDYELCDLRVGSASVDEDGFQGLWQTFFDTIAIEERRNPVCQRNFMPKRFWGNMCEHVPPALRKRPAHCQTPTEAARSLSAKALLVAGGKEV